MKIVFVIKALSLPGGGAERVLAEVASGLARRGHQVTVASFDASRTTDFYPFDPAVNRVRLEIGQPDRPTTLFSVVRRVAALRGLLTPARPAVVVGFMHSGFIPAALALAGSRIPVIGSEHIVYSHYAKRHADRLMLHVAAPFLAAMTAISEDVRRHYPALLRRKMRVVANPVGLSPAERADPVGSDAGRVLLTVGRLAEQKDHATLIDAFAEVAGDFPEWTLRIVGEGDRRTPLERQMRERGLDGRVVLPGVTAAIGVEYAAAQLFAMSSSYESFGLATAEAMAHGLPAVGFADCPGTNELIVDGQTGLLVAGADRVAAFAAGLRTLMSSPGRRAAMGAAAPARLARFAPERVVDRWEELLREIVPTPPLAAI